MDLADWVALPIGFHQIMGILRRYFPSGLGVLQQILLSDPRINDVNDSFSQEAAHFQGIQHHTA